MRHTTHLSDEEGQANANRRNESTLVFFRRQHENRKDELGGEKHLDK